MCDATNKLVYKNSGLTETGLTVFKSSELNGVTEVARHTTVEHADACRDPGVRPQMKCPRSHLPVAMATRQVLAGVRQRRTEQHRRPVAEDYVFSIPNRWITLLPELQLQNEQLLRSFK